MKISAFICLLLFQFVFNGHIKSQSIVYVSTKGNDQWSGKLASPNKNLTDGPFKTLERAKNKVMELKRTGSSGKKGIIVMIRGGVYYMKQTLAFNDSLSGTNNNPVIWKNYSNEKVVLSGGTEIQGFQKISDPDVLKRIKEVYQKKIVEINLRSRGITDYGNITNRGGPGMELFCNNQKMRLARWPNVGFDTITSVPQTGELVYAGNPNRMVNGFPKGRHYGRISYSCKRPNQWSHVEDILLYGFWVFTWSDEYVHVQSIDTAKNEIIIKPPHSRYGYMKGGAFCALNVLEELDQPGEWYLDRTNGKIYFWPPENVKPGKTYVSLLEKPMMTLENTHNIRIEGLTFEYSRNSGVIINGGENNVIAGCTFSNLGGTAVLINGGTKNGITSSDLFNLAGVAIRLSGGNRKSLTPGENFVSNNHIHHFGQWLKTLQPAISIGGVGNRIDHNLIHDGPNSGIMLSGNENVIEYNELHHLGLETADVGAFYIGRDWTQRGNKIQYNFFHDLSGPGENYVNGVYLDDFTSGTIVYGNIFLRCPNGIEIGGGRDNVILNNIFIENNIGIRADSRGTTWAKYFIDGTDSTLYHEMNAMNFSKPPYSEKYPALLNLYNDDPGVPKNNLISHNISYREKWVVVFDGLDINLLKVQDNLVSSPEVNYENAKDHIVKGNPGILDYSAKNLKLDPKVYTKGFKKIPFEKIGLKNDRYRSNVK